MQISSLVQNVRQLPVDGNTIPSPSFNAATIAEGLEFQVLYDNEYTQVDVDRLRRILVQFLRGKGSFESSWEWINFPAEWDESQRRCGVFLSAASWLDEPVTFPLKVYVHNLEDVLCESRIYFGPSEEDDWNRVLNIELDAELSDTLLNRRAANDWLLAALVDCIRKDAAAVENEEWFEVPYRF
ncbi:hypothetical protein VNI00_014903 [Paramarasmius palmivorus]|uniref:Uncharacterized protein n=1 Tax=Paramarasmius palmivorus TaxID=297713 RepID=A0AAW0BN91_9AGAR